MLLPDPILPCRFHASGSGRPLGLKASAHLHHRRHTLLPSLPQLPALPAVSPVPLLVPLPLLIPLPLQLPVTLLITLALLRFATPTGGGT